MSKALDPVNVLPGWHRFLYRSVLLEWETTTHSRQKFPRFNGRKPLCCISLVKVDVLKDMEHVVTSNVQSPKPVEQLVFFSSGTALKDLLGLMRNCVAHGHYSCLRHGWIEFHHVYKGKTKLYGQAKFDNLKSLITAIVQGSDQGERLKNEN